MIRRILVFATLVLLSPIAPNAQENTASQWQFAVSGDSRNCGDVVMPAIAESVLKHHKVEFYWHLGDFRLGSGIDEDMRQVSAGEPSLADYQQRAWDDFIENQVDPFGSLTVHLGIGNHELYLRRTTSESHADFIKKFSAWLGGSKTAYYHWKLNHVDFITLDNSGNAGFESDQLTWLETVLTEDKSDDKIHAIVVGMHRALPNSLACGHSMNGDPYSSDDDNSKSLDSGRRAYGDLWDSRNTTGKQVYVLASHSHFYMENIFDTPYWHSRTLNGLLIGTAGAVRYRLPDNLPPKTLAVTYAYGYLLGTVNADGPIAFEFQQITERDVPSKIVHDYGKPFVDFCFLANRDDTVHVPVKSCSDQ